jgi:hypothetical protein
LECGGRRRFLSFFLSFLSFGQMAKSGGRILGLGGEVNKKKKNRNRRIPKKSLRTREPVPV